MIKRFFLLFVLLLSYISEMKADSTVYFFVDFRYYNKEYQFNVNGQPGFSLLPEGKLLCKECTQYMYNMVARKVIFKKADSYVISTDCPTPSIDYHVEMNLNIEDGETYYVILNASLKKSMYLELLSEKDGLKLLKKAQTSSKYTFNEDYVYEGN